MRGPPTADQTPRVVGEVPSSAGLLLVAGDGFVWTYPLEREELVIGRDPSCDVVIEHRSLSRRHAILRPGTHTTVQDLGSTNGTRVGGVVRRGGDPVAIELNDSFQIGRFSFVVVAQAPRDDPSLSGRRALQVIDPTRDGVPSLVREVAASGASVLILGETGVGKEVLADTLHELSARTGPLARINCAALSETLLESELFGHEKGAFTGAAAQKVGLLEAAHGGTVFLDEIGETPPAIQAKLLRVVEHREILRLGSTRPIPIDVRFVAATNRDLSAEVAAGRFRRDLFFRLDGVTLAIPPLRERRGLIGPLALRFIEAASRIKRPARLAGDVLAALEAHDWPGNVRELKAVIDRAVLLARGGDIGVRHLNFARHDRSASEPALTPPPELVTPPPVPIAHGHAQAHAPTGPAQGDPVLDFLDEEQRADRAQLLSVLEACSGNQTRAAKMLGIGRTTLVNKLRLYRIPRPRS